MLNFLVDQEKCTKCGDCIKDCPVGIIAFSPEYPDIIEGKEDECISCQHCFTICEPGAISIFGLNPDESMPLKGNLPNGKQMECLIKGRRSIRHYEKEPVDSNTISHLLTVVANGPTSMNDQLLFTVPSPEPDAVIALSYFELLAQSVGLGTTWCNLAEWAVASIIPDMKRKLNIPHSHIIGYMMLFGKPAVTYYRTVQRNNVKLNRVVWND